MSPNEYWNTILINLSILTMVFIFLFQPFLYFVLVRKLDKEFHMKNYTVEKGTWFIGVGLRMVSYTLGIILQPYRDKDHVSPLLKALTKKRFHYQDKLYSKPVDYRRTASKLQIVCSYLYWIGVGIFLLTGILVLIHNFFIYPEFAAQMMK